MRMRTLGGFGKEGKRGALQRLEKIENPSSGRALYIALGVLSVVPTGRRYYRGPLKIETEGPYRYTAPVSVLPGGGPVVPTWGR
jgi:hypothetical protein